jgi:hypothetical protein
VERVVLNAVTDQCGAAAKLPAPSAISFGIVFGEADPPWPHNKHAIQNANRLSHD